MNVTFGKVTAMNNFAAHSRAVATPSLRAPITAARNGLIVIRGADLIGVAGETRLEHIDPCGVDAGFTLTAANVVGGIGPAGTHAVDGNLLANALGTARAARLEWTAGCLAVNGQVIGTVEIEAPFADLRLDSDRPIRSGRFDPERLGAVASAAGTSVRYRAQRRELRLRGALLGGK